VKEFRRRLPAVVNSNLRSPPQRTEESTETLHRQAPSMTNSSNSKSRNFAITWQPGKQSSTQMAGPPAQFPASSAQFPASSAHFAAPLAQLAASTAQPSTFPAFPAQSGQPGSLGADTEGELLPSLAHAVSRGHPSLPRPLILAIFRGKFHLKDLCKLRLLHGQEAERSEEIVVINGKMLWKKRTGELKDFGTTHQPGLMDSPTTFRR
jgi:hypothetical protein